MDALTASPTSLEIIVPLPPAEWGPRMGGHRQRGKAGEEKDEHSRLRRARTTLQPHRRFRVQKRGRTAAVRVWHCFINRRPFRRYSSSVFSPCNSHRANRGG